MSPKPQTTILSHSKAPVLSYFLLWRRVLILSSMVWVWLVSGRAVGGAGCVRGRGLSQAHGHVALLWWCDLVLCGIHPHLPDSEGPGGIVEQGQKRVLAFRSQGELCRRDPCLSFLSRAGWDPAQPRGRALPLSSCCAPQPLLHCCSCPGSINLSQGLGGGWGQGEEGPLACVWLR